MTSPTTDRRFGVNGSLAFKAPVALATTANITLSGEQTIDGVLTSASRVLVKDQTDTTANGLYDSSSSAWTRCVDADGNRDLVNGTLVHVTGGSQAGTIWKLNATDPITVGTSAVTFSPSLTAAISTLSYVQAGTGAVTRDAQTKMRESLSTFDFMTAAQIADVLSGGFTLDCRAAVQAAVAAAIANGVKKIRAPGKGYLINGVTSSDTVKNGILIPFSAVNFDPADQLIFEGDGAGTVFRCGSTGMVMFRASRNCFKLRDITIDGNSLSNTWGVGIIPESMTQTTTQVSQSMIDIIDVSRVNLTEGIVIQPGPQVSGSDSGCFYHNIVGGISNNNTRHVFLKKNVDWASHPNKPTRTNFYGQRLTRGNTGYYLEVGSEILISGCNEEMLNTGSSPLATPTARWVSSDCSNVTFVGGYSESCTKSVTLAANNLTSFGYIPASGSNTDWRTYARTYGDATDDDATFTPVLVGTGGANGTNSSVAHYTKVGKLVSGTMAVSYDGRGSMTGPVSITGFPFVADDASDLQALPIPVFTGVTLASTNHVNLCGRISGSTITPSVTSRIGVGLTALDASTLSTGPYTLVIPFSIRAV